MVALDMRTRGVIDMALGALANDTAILATTKIDTSRLMGCRPKWINYAIEWRGKTTLEGPCVYGVCDDLTIAQISEWFDADPQHDGDAGAQEASTRHAFILGYMSLVATTSQTNQVEMDRIQRVRWPGWEIIEGESLNFFVLNPGVTLTSGTLVDGVLEILGDWIDK